MSFARLSAIEAFLTVVDTGGFGDAARELGLSQSSVSRRVAQLEEHLGCKLFARSTRHVSLTDVGHVFAEETRAALAGLRRAEIRATAEDAILSGLVQITMPSAYGRLVVIPTISSLIAQHPLIRFNLNLSDRYVDLSADPYDLAIRFTDEVPSGWKVVQLKSVGGGLYAGPAYLRQNKPPRSPADLKSHRLLTARTYAPRTTWKLRWHGTESLLEIVPAVIASDFSALYDLAVSGVGIAALPEYVAGEGVKNGTLIEILTGAVTERWPVFAAYPQHLLNDRRIRSVIESLEIA
jgi:DNA-binding transcriptional LysR family regulator